ncbi:MAG: flavin reductase [Lachnospiraceae bacterium]|nr:flavin reductase [Lachnospiraceae bacterium]
MKFVNITPTDITENSFKLIGNDWMLITANGKDKAGNEKVNTMTASWGGTGIMWGTPVAFVVIRESRYTKEFVDNSDSFSLTFFDESYRAKLGYLGKVSGRDEDKIKESGLTVATVNDTPYFEEAKLVLRCEKLYCAPMNKEGFLDSSILNKWYEGGDYHTLYVAKITNVLSR